MPSLQKWQDYLHLLSRSERCTLLCLDDSRDCLLQPLESSNFASGNNIFLRLQGRVEGWSKEWQLSVAEQQKLYLAVADLLRTNKVRIGCQGCLYLHCTTQLSC